MTATTRDRNEGVKPICPRCESLEVLPTLFGMPAFDEPVRNGKLAIERRGGRNTSGAVGDYSGLAREPRTSYFGLAVQGSGSRVLGRRRGGRERHDSYTPAVSPHDADRFVHANDRVVCHANDRSVCM